MCVYYELDHGTVSSLEAESISAKTRRISPLECIIYSLTLFGMWAFSFVLLSVEVLAGRKTFFKQH